MGSTPMENEKEFRDWLRAQVKQDGMRLYSDNEIAAYCYALKQGIATLPCVPISNMFVISDHNNFTEKVNTIKLIPEFDDLDKEDHGTDSAACELYQYYLEHGRRSDAPDVHARFYLTREKDKTVDKGEKKKGPAMEAFHYQEVRMNCIQKVFYGAPGTGKSHSVNTLLSKAYPEDDKLRNHIKRVIFHPAYTYGEFVGAIKPVSSPDRPVEHTFVAGPFTELLKAAFLNPEEKYFLVIEEINRGNAPSIFGDIFQLLDRGPDGKSSYSIVNRDIGGFFSKDPWMKNIFYDGRIWLPANFNILATMNTADDNIFVMDSAFKRRFELEYVPINYNILPQSMRDEREIFKGKVPLDELFSDTTTIVGAYAQKLKERGTLKRNWPTFSALVNDAIDRENLEMKRERRANDKLIAENKKLGPYFIREHELEDRITFMNKVVFYLKQDVFTESYRFFTESFEDIFEKYSDPDSDIFEMLLEARYDENGALIRTPAVKKEEPKKAEAKAETKAEAKAEAKAETKAEPKTETKAEAKTEAKAEAKAAKTDMMSALNSKFEEVKAEVKKEAPVAEEAEAEEAAEVVEETAANEAAAEETTPAAEEIVEAAEEVAEEAVEEAPAAEEKVEEPAPVVVEKVEEPAPAEPAKPAPKKPTLSAEEAAALKAALGITSSTVPTAPAPTPAPAEPAPMTDAQRAAFYAAPDASSEDAFRAAPPTLSDGSTPKNLNASSLDMYEKAGMSRPRGTTRSANITSGSYYDASGNLAGGAEVKESFAQFGREMEPDNFSQDFF